MNKNGKRKPTVCVYSWHPLVLSEFRRLLPAQHFSLQARRLDRTAIASPSTLRVARAAVHLVEAHTDSATTEALVVQILSCLSGARVIVVAETFDESAAFSLVRAGAKGLVSFDEASRRLSKAVREVFLGGVWVPRGLLSRIIDSASRVFHNRSTPNGSSPLSRRERQVRELILQNCSNREIAHSLNLSERTAKFHVANLLAKCGVKRRADLVVLTYARDDRQGSLKGFERRERQPPSSVSAAPVAILAPKEARRSSRGRQPSVRA